MARLMLPSITKLEDVLDLLTDPKKYQAYLEDFKQVHAQAMEALGTLKTKQDADAVLASAYDMKEKIEKQKELFAAQCVKRDNELDNLYTDFWTSKTASDIDIKEQQVTLAKAQAKLDASRAEYDSYVASTNIELKQKHDAIEAQVQLFKVEKQEVEKLKAKFEHAMAALQ